MARPHSVVYHHSEPMRPEGTHDPDERLIQPPISRGFSIVETPGNWISFKRTSSTQKAKLNVVNWLINPNPGKMNPDLLKIR